MRRCPAHATGPVTPHIHGTPAKTAGRGRSYGRKAPRCRRDGRWALCGPPGPAAALRAWSFVTPMAPVMTRRRCRRQAAHGITVHPSPCPAHRTSPSPGCAADHSRPPPRRVQRRLSGRVHAVRAASTGQAVPQTPSKRRWTLRERRMRPGGPRRVPGRMPRIGRKGRVVAASVLRVLEREGPKCDGARGGHSNPPTQKPRRAVPARLLVERRCHTPVTDCVDAPGPECPDLALRAHLGLVWTPMDSVYHLCHVGPARAGLSLLATLVSHRRDVACGEAAAVPDLPRPLNSGRGSHSACCPESRRRTNSPASPQLRQTRLWREFGEYRRPWGARGENRLRNTVRS